jgi:hypothetical protein
MKILKHNLKKITNRIIKKYYKKKKQKIDRYHEKYFEERSTQFHKMYNFCIICNIEKNISYLAIHLMDRVYNKFIFNKPNWNLISTTCFLISAKFLQDEHTSIKDIVHLLEPKTICLDSIKCNELFILRILDYRIDVSMVSICKD